VLECADLATASFSKDPVTLFTQKAPLHIPTCTKLLQAGYLGGAYLREGIKFATYWQIKGQDSYAYETYLTDVVRVRHRMALSEFRSGSHWLRIQQGRFSNLAREDRLCQHCELQIVEDESHMLFECPAHDALRHYFGLTDMLPNSNLGTLLGDTPNTGRMAAFLAACKTSSQGWCIRGCDLHQAVSQKLRACAPHAAVWRHTVSG